MVEMIHTTEAMYRANVRAAGIRESMADRLQEMVEAGHAILAMWHEFGLEGDFLSEEEYPFDQSLDEWVARCEDAVTRIRQTNELLRLKPQTLTLDPRDFQQLLDALEQPAKVNPKLAAMLRDHADWVD